MSSITISDTDYRVHGMASWEKAALLLLKGASSSRIWCFYGDLGSGKTTCIKALCRVLGVKEVVKSPSFGLLHEYLTEGGELIYHFDLYRLASLQEALDIGVESYLGSGSYCFIEWPELIKPLLDRHYLDLFFTLPEQGGRQVKVMVHGPTGKQAKRANDGI